MKRIEWLLLPLLALTLTACGGLDDKSSGSAFHDQDSQALVSTADESAGDAGKAEVPEGALVDYSGEFVFDGKLQQIGDDENGYMKVPLGYQRFQDEDVEGLTQYCDVSGTNILTLEHYQGLSYMAAAENMRAYLAQQDTVQDIQGATVQVADYNALQLYGHYGDGFYIVTWFIEDPANPAESSYYLSIEFDAEHQNLIACSSSFQTVEDYHAQESTAE